MVGLLCHVIEFRNGESGLHVLHIRVLTKLLLEELNRVSPQYSMSQLEIDTYSLASSLHDIGKTSISQTILNKAGKLTPEEFSVMRDHAIIGASMLEELAGASHSPLIRVSMDICRWHHERYDGSGYPDKLVGDQTPIYVQAVGLADVYDSLTRDRVYRDACSHEDAVGLILEGKVGAFHPLLLECLRRIQRDIPRALEKNTIWDTNV